MGVEHGFRIYYGDDSVYEGPPEDAPGQNVQVIVQFDDARCAWYTQASSDYYVWRDGQWYGVDWVGWLEYEFQTGWHRTIFGRTISNARFQAILRRARGSYGPKGAYLPGERQGEGDIV